jgi:hypothetical protein
LLTCLAGAGKTSLDATGNEMGYVDTGACQPSASQV